MIPLDFEMFYKLLIRRVKSSFPPVIRRTYKNLGAFLERSMYSFFIVRSPRLTTASMSSCWISMAQYRWINSTPNDSLLDSFDSMLRALGGCSVPMNGDSQYSNRADVIVPWVGSPK